MRFRDNIIRIHIFTLSLFLCHTLTSQKYPHFSRRMRILLLSGCPTRTRSRVARAAVQGAGGGAAWSASDSSITLWSRHYPWTYSSVRWEPQAPECSTSIDGDDRESSGRVVTWFSCESLNGSPFRTTCV